MATKKREKFAIVSLVVYSLLASSMGILVRQMDRDFTVYQQVFGRAFVGFIIGCIIFNRKLNIRKMIKMPMTEFGLLTLRSVSLYLLGITLYTKSINISTYSNVALIFAIPYSAILGVFLLGETLNWRKIILVIMSFVGVIAISLEDTAGLSGWGMGEILAVISAFFYTVSSVLRKKQSDYLNNHEIAVFMLLEGFIIILSVSLASGDNMNLLLKGSAISYVSMFVAGLLNALFGLLLNYGYKYMDALRAGNILFLETVFGVFVGLAIYSEMLTYKDIVGASLILFSAYLTNRVK